VSAATLQIIATGRYVRRYQCIVCGATVVCLKEMTPAHGDCTGSHDAIRQAARQLGNPPPEFSDEDAT
jgi:hypothetical protein